MSIRLSECSRVSTSESPAILDTIRLSACFRHDATIRHFALMRWHLTFDKIKQKPRFAENCWVNVTQMTARRSQWLLSSEPLIINRGYATGVLLLQTAATRSVYAAKYRMSTSFHHCGNILTDKKAGITPDNAIINDNVTSLLFGCSDYHHTIRYAEILKAFKNWPGSVLV